MTDCKSAIPGSNPGGAFFLILPHPLAIVLRTPHRIGTCVNGRPVAGDVAALSGSQADAWIIPGSCMPACMQSCMQTRQVAICPGRLEGRRLCPRGGRWQVRQLVEGGGLVVQSQVRVAVHRQRDGRVPGQCLGDLGMNSCGREVADELVTQRVKVEDTPFIIALFEAIGGPPVLQVLLVVLGFRQPLFPRRGQVLPKHLCRMLPPDARPELLLSRPASRSSASQRTTAEGETSARTTAQPVSGRECSVPHANTHPQTDTQAIVTEQRKIGSVSVSHGTVRHEISPCRVGQS